MHILLVNSIGKNKWGGGEKWMVLAAQELSKKGHKVLIGCRANSIVETRAKEAGIQVVRLCIYTDISVKGYFQLKSICQKESIELVIGCQNKDVRVAGFMSRMNNGPKVISRQGVQLLRNKSKYKWSFLPYCDGIITNTYSLKKEYDSYGWWDDEFVKVIFNGINTDVFSKEIYDLSEYVQEDELKPIKIVSTGRLASQKGFEYLLDAAKPIIEKYPHVYFFIAGQGKLESSLKRQINRLGIERNVHLLGFQKNVSSLLNAADLFVLPSLFEGMPNSLMEALAHGLPAVSTNVNGVSELMIDDEHGYIVQSGDSKQLQEAIEMLIADGDFKKKGLAGAEHVKQAFSIDSMIENVESHLLQLLSK